MTDFLQLVTTIDSEEGARLIARRLVEARLAACVQIAGPISSTYIWQGRVETAREWQCLIKTRRELYAAATTVIKDLHPYEVPEILVFSIIAGDESYLNWLEETLPAE